MFMPPAPQTWHYHQSIDMLITANWTVMGYAARNHDDVLFNEYRMAKDSIEHGSEDYWTIYPKRVDAIKAAYEADVESGKIAASVNRRGNAGHSAGFAANALFPIPSVYYDKVMKDPALRDPRGYIISADQADFPTAVKFVNSLIRGGVEVERSTASFSVGGKSDPAGSYIVKTDQAYRPLVLDMFEPQDYPMDIKYPGGPPVPPYDAAGWTLAMEMGFDFDRELEAFNGPFEKLGIGKEVVPPPVKVAGSSAGGWILSPKNNDSFLLVNTLLSAGAEVYRLPQGDSAAGSIYGPGTFYVAPSTSAGLAIAKAAADMGVTATTVSAKPDGSMIRLAPARIAVWEKYGGSQNAGWMRWVMENYGFKYTMLFPKEIDAGDLHSKYDIIVFAPGAIPMAGFPIDNPQENFMGRMPKDPDIDPKYRSWTGVLSIGKSIPSLKKFAEDGGTIITMGESSHLADDFGAPVIDMISPDKKPLTHEQFFIPGSLLTGAVDTSLPVAWGTSPSIDFYFDSTGFVGTLGAPVFKLSDGAAAAGIKPIVTFGTSPPLASGWAVGQEHLANGIAAFMMPVGKGNLYAYSMEPTFRNWSHSTFKLLFNELYTITPAP
jgi:hypothetical protein